MAAEDAVLTAAYARDEVRKSLARMDYHLARGPRGLRGVQREVAFLDALGRQSARLGAQTAAGVNVGTKGLGTRALEAMQSGPGAKRGRIKSSILAEFSQDTMSGAREWTYSSDANWVWRANASACAACLSQHGSVQAGPFWQMHPSCLCYPEDVGSANAAGVRPLSDQEVVQTLVDSNNAQFASVGRMLERGQLTVEEAAQIAMRRSRKGLERWVRAIKDQAQRVADGIVPQVVVQVTDDFIGTQGVLGALDDLTPAQVQAAADEIFTPEQIDFLQGRARFGAYKHQQVVQDAQAAVNDLIDSIHYRRKLNAAMANLDEFSTYAKGESSTTGGFSWSVERFTGNRVNRRMELNMRRFDDARLAEFNEQQLAVNEAVRAAQEARRRGDMSSTEYFAELRRLEKQQPSKRLLYRDTTPEELADTLVHEGFHAIDEAAGFKYARRAVDEIQEEVRSIYRSGAPDAEAWSYASELVNPPIRGYEGVETAAEVVRMYFMGTGEQATSRGLTALTAQEWRERYPRLRAWVEEVLLD